MAQLDPSTEFYRALPIGIALIKSLNEMLETKQISSDEAFQILTSYDRILQEELALTCKYLKSNEKCTTEIEGTCMLESYQILFESWRVDVSNLVLKIDSKRIKLGNTRILFKTS